MFPENGNVIEDLKQVIVEDLRVREESACSTWNIDATLKLPWGVKSIVNGEYVEEIENYFNEIVGSKIIIDEEREVDILRGGLKERKGVYTLIFRYQLIIKKNNNVAFSF